MGPIPAYMQYKSIDLLKFVMAIMVVGIHADAIVDEDMPFLLSMMARWAVPFFFITSGFLLFRKISAVGDVLKPDGLLSVKQYVHKSARLYVMWTLLYLPVTLFVFCLNDRSWGMDVLVFIRGFLFVGEQAYSWPLWYLLATVVAVFLIGVGLRCRMKLSVIFVVGVVLMGLGWWLQLALDGDAEAGSQPCSLWAERLVVGSTRNGVFSGLALVAAGMMVWRFGWARKQFLPLQVLLILTGGGISIL